MFIYQFCKYYGNIVMISFGIKPKNNVKTLSSIVNIKISPIFSQCTFTF